MSWSYGMSEDEYENDVKTWETYLACVSDEIIERKDAEQWLKDFSELKDGKAQDVLALRHSDKSTCDLIQSALKEVEELKNDKN